MTELELVELAVLHRGSFDSLVEGDPTSWRQCTQKWWTLKKSDHDWIKYADIQAFLDRSHDLSMTKIHQSGRTTLIEFQSGKTLRFEGVSRLLVSPAHESPPFAFLYGEVHAVDRQVYVHLLFDIIDIYLLCEMIDAA
jgi:hypothetical protein